MTAQRSTTGSLAMSAGPALLASFCFLVAVPAAPAQSIPEPVNQPSRSTTVLRPEANRLPDANDIMEMRETKISRARFEAANLERKRQIDSDSALLVKLATEVKDEVDKDPANASSLAVLSKLEAIQRLAHSVQVKMKLTIIPAQ